MSTATIIKVCVILAGLGIMAVTFVLHAKKKLTINLNVINLKAEDIYS